MRAALDNLGVRLLGDHMETFVLGQGGGSAPDQTRGKTQEELLAEVKAFLSRFLRWACFAG